MKIRTKLYFSMFIFSVSFNVASQTCDPEKSASTPQAGFTVHDNGTGTHNKTNLMWRVCSQGQTWSTATGCDGVVTGHIWDEAMKIPETFNAAGGYAGHNDWRLPNITELSSIAELKCQNPAINSKIFPLALPYPSTFSAGYWSSSLYPDYYFNA